MADRSLADIMRLEEAAPADVGPKLDFFVVNQAAHEAWCAERGFKVEQYQQYLNWMLAPRDG